MGKIITKSTGEKQKGAVSLEGLQDFFFFLYLVATTAHQTGEGFDAFFIRATFVLFFGFSVLQMIITRYFKWNSLTAWFLIFLGFGYLSCLWASSVPDVLFYNNTFIQMVGCIICLTNRIKKYEDIDMVLKLIVFSLMYAAIYLLIITPSDSWGTLRVGAELGLHANEIGLRFAIGVVIALYLSGIKKQWGYYIPLLLFLIVVLFTGSRKSIIMCLAIFVFYPMLSSVRKRSMDDLLRLFFQIIAIVVVVAVIFYLVMKVEIFYDVIGIRLETMFDAFFVDESADASVVERNFFIRKGMELFEENPVLGYGMNNFKTYMAEINYSHRAYSHNNYVELLATLGLTGFAIYYSMIAMMLVRGFRIFIKKDEGHSRNTMLMLILLIISILSYWCVSYQSEYFIIVYALVYMNVYLHMEEKKNAKKVAQGYQRAEETTLVFGE